MGSDLAAYDSSSMLATMPAPVSTLGSGRVKPSVYFIPIDQPTSSRPATTSRIQAMTGPPRRAGAGDASSLPASRYGASRRVSFEGSKKRLEGAGDHGHR